MSDEGAVGVVEIDSETAWLARQSAASLRTSFAPPLPLNIWQWAESALDFSLAPSYDTPLHGPYDAGYMPYWKEIAECVTAPDVREVIVLKATRAGGSENVLLNSIRYAVAVRPQPVLYVTSDQLSAERFMEKRIKRGMKCAVATARELREASATQHDITFRAMDFRVTWPRAKQAFKQDGWSLVLCDEVSTWPEYSADMARRRCDSYPFAHIVFLSSPDPAQRRPSDDDPIFVEWERGDRREWYMPDPSGAGEFRWEMGSAGAAGLRWDAAAKRDDGTWDLDRVEASAHYMTPGGARIDEADRARVMRLGAWRATAAGKATVRSYRVNRFMVPFASCSFGRIAVDFLKAKSGGSVPMRSFVYESLAEKWYEKIDTTTDDALSARCAEYAIRELPSTKQFFIGKTPTRLVTVDVQKAHLWAVCREWASGGDSGLVDYCYLVAWEQVEELANKYSALRVGVDCGYETRNVEVYEYALKCQAIPMRGSDSLSYVPIKQQMIDPFEGRGGNGNVTIPSVTFNADVFKSILLDMMRGETMQKWMLPKGIKSDYLLQAGSEEKVDGVWRTKRGRAQNHLADCETMQLVLAYLLGIYRNQFLFSGAKENSIAQKE